MEGGGRDWKAGVRELKKNGKRKTPDSGINCRVFFKGCYKMLRGVIY